MPNAKILSEKQAIVADLTEKFQNAAAGVIVDYRGITVAEDTELRAQMRANGVEYFVVKNTLARFAAKNVGLDALCDVLEGTTSIAVCEGDPVAVQALAEMPSREVLVATVLGTLIAPIRGLATVLYANISGLARVMQAIADQKGA